MGFNKLVAQSSTLNCVAQSFLAYIRKKRWEFPKRSLESRQIVDDSFKEWRGRLANGKLTFEERRFYEFAISEFLQEWESGPRMTATPSRRQANRFLERHYSEAVMSEADLDVWRDALEWLFEYGGIKPAPDELADPNPDPLPDVDPATPQIPTMFLAADDEPFESDSELQSPIAAVANEIAPDVEDAPELPPLLRGGFDRAAKDHGLGESTAKAYWNWLRRFGGFCLESGRELDDPEAVSPFLRVLTAVDKLAPQSSNQGLIALKFVFRHVFQPGVELDVEPARKRDRTPVTLSRRELDQLFAVMESESGLMCRLMYGAGLRTPELLELRVRDLDFGQQLLRAPGSSDEAEREAPLPQSMLQELRDHLQRVRAIFESERDELPGVDLPEDVAKAEPALAKDWNWQWVFPSRNLTRDKDSGERRRHHWNAFTFQRSVKKAAKLAGIEKRVTPHTFRHSFALHLLQAGTEPKRVQEVMGHRTLETTMSYVYAIEGEKEKAPRSPLDY